MKMFRVLGLLVAVVYGVIACSSVVDDSPVGLKSGVESLKIVNLKHPRKNVLSSGQPSQEQIRGLAGMGVSHIINLRPSSELDWDESVIASDAGISYHQIPISGGADINKANAKQLFDLLGTLKDESVLVHCGSSNRVGALAAVFEAKQNGGDVDAAINTGKQWGLTGLETTTRNYLEESK